MTVAVLESVRDYDPLLDKSYQATGLGPAIADHLARKRTQGRAERTLDDRERYLSSFALMFPSKAPRDFTPFDCDHWQSAQPKKSRRHRSSHINDFFEWAENWDLIDKNPMARLEPIQRESNKVYDIFTEAEIEAMCGIRLVDGALMRILLDAGIRKSEARALRVGHFRPVSTLSAPHGELAVFGGKGAKDRLVTSSRELEQAVADLTIMESLGPNDFFWYSQRASGHWRQTRRNGPIQETTFVRWWERCLQDAGVRYRNPHMTRHTYATRYLRDGGRLETLSMSMGHASIRTTFDLYAHLDTKDMARDMAIIQANREMTREGDGR